MNDPNRPQDDVRDPNLGAALRRALEPGDSAAFVSAVLSRLDHRQAETSFLDVLSTWARRGIPAAIAVTIFVAFLVGLQRRPAEPLEDALLGGDLGVNAMLFTSNEPPEAGIFLAGPMEP